VEPAKISKTTYTPGMMEAYAHQIAQVIYDQRDIQFYVDALWKASQDDMYLYHALQTEYEKIEQAVFAEQRRIEMANELKQWEDGFNG